MMHYGPSVNLSWKDLDCHDGTEYPVQWRQDRAILVASMFEMFRAFCGDIQLTVNCGYRTPERNSQVGGAKHSQHLQGLAIDIAKPSCMTLKEFHTVARHFARGYRGQGRVGGIGYYKWGVHLDVRSTPRLISWGNSSADPRA